MFFHIKPQNFARASIVANKKRKKRHALQIKDEMTGIYTRTAAKPYSGIDLGKNKAINEHGK